MNATIQKPRKSAKIHARSPLRQTEAREDRRESCNELVHALARTVGTLDFCPFDIGDVVVQRELLVAILAVKNILRHDSAPANMITPIAVNQRATSWQVSCIYVWLAE
jgi:hypothetical protein